MKYVIYDSEGNIQNYGSAQKKEHVERRVDNVNTFVLFDPPEITDAKLVRIVDGGVVERPNADEILNQRQLDQIRINRDYLLKSSDWTQLPDAPLTGQEKADWARYRQGLRDLPKNTQDPKNPQWPVKPND